MSGVFAVTLLPTLALTVYNDVTWLAVQEGKNVVGNFIDERLTGMCTGPGDVGRHDEVGRGFVQQGVALA